MRTELHTLARLRSPTLPQGPSRCAICGDSPYAAAGHWRLVLGQNFTNFDVINPNIDTVCAGCQSLLAGSPGSIPPPLRTGNVAVLDGEISYPDRPGIYSAMMTPERVQVLSWATGRKKHHWLYCGMCTQGKLRIGADDGTIEYAPQTDRELFDAIRALLRSPTGTGPLLSRESIRTGVYHPAAVHKFGASEWERLERIVSKWRPSPLLDLGVTVTPVTMSESQQEDFMLTDQERMAVGLLKNLAQASTVRREDGKVFWGGFAKHRLERFRSMPIHDMVSRLMAAWDVAPTDPSALVALRDISIWSGQTEGEVARIIETRPALILALAYSCMKEDRE